MKKIAEELIETDPELKTAENAGLRNFILSLHGKTPWSKIS